MLRFWRCCAAVVTAAVAAAVVAVVAAAVVAGARLGFDVDEGMREGGRESEIR